MGVREDDPTNSGLIDPARVPSDLLPDVRTSYRVYQRENFVLRDGKHWLPVHQAGREFFLPVVNVGTSEQSIAIAWLDTDPKKNPELTQAAATVMAKIISDRKAVMVAMPGSTKSEWFIQQAAGLASPVLGREVTVVRFPTGKRRKDVQGQSDLFTTREYHPVTLKPDETKYIGLGFWMYEEIHRACPNGEGLLFVDDVHTTGATVNAMMEILGLTNKSRHEIAVLANEKSVNDASLVALPENMYAVFGLPIIIGEIPYTQLHEIKDVPAVIVV